MLKGWRGVLIHQRFPRAKKSIAPVDPGRNPLSIFAVTKLHPLAAVIANHQGAVLQSSGPKGIPLRRQGPKSRTSLSIYQINEWGMNLGANIARSQRGLINIPQ
jgi:hypothetical protein